MRRKKFLKADIVNYPDWIYPRNIEPREFREWLELRNTKTLPLHLELGMGSGDFLIQMALEHPDRFFLGVEIKEERVLQAMRRSEELGLENIAFLQCPIQQLERYALPKVSTIFTFFSDPWPKKRHHKRRLTSEIYLRMYEKLMAPGAELWMKTDHQELYEHSLEYLAERKWEVLEQSADYQTPEAFQSRFERKWKALGKSVCFLRAQPVK